MSVERLTKRITGGMKIRNTSWHFDQRDHSNLQDALEKLAAYEDTGMKPEEINEMVFDDAIDIKLGVTIDRLRELAEAEKDGRCVVLPCLFYSEVYALSQVGKEIIHGELRSTNKDYCLIVNLEGSLTSSGKTWHGIQVRKQDVFLTREAAEAALEAQK